jgi:hypothetical protein
MRNLDQTIASPPEPSSAPSAQPPSFKRGDMVPIGPVQPAPAQPAPIQSALIQSAAVPLPCRDDVTQAVTRGVGRALGELGYGVLTEVSLASGRRADIMAIDRAGEIVIVEVKSSIEDFRTDQKWPEYRDWCDRLYFAVAEEFPRDILPEDTGLMIADRFSAVILRPAPATPLASARRRALLLRFAMLASTRLWHAIDPGI